MAVDLVCVRTFGNYKPGDAAGSVPDDAAYNTDYFAPSGHPAAVTAISDRDAQIAALQAELEGLEKETD